MKIHHIESSYEDRFVLDPALGPVKRRELIMRKSGVTCIAHNGENYDIDSEGTFDVPDEVGAALLGRASGAGSWQQGPNPFAEEYAPKRKARASKGDDE